MTGELSPNVWYFAQLGLVEVAYQLRRINHHLKVFAAMRKEAYARCRRRRSMAQQYRGSAVDIVYSLESLREIFVNNIRLEKSRPDGAARAAARRSARGVPRPDEGRRTPTPREEEDAFEYICRHTLLRPRDLMTIGERLAALRPEERRHEHRLKEAVNQAATEIAHEYLAEIAPYVGDLDLERLFRRLPGHVLTRDEVEELFPSTAATGGAVERAARVLRALPRRAARLRPSRSGPRRVGAAIPAARRGDARARRRAAARDALPRAPGAVGRDRPSAIPPISQRIDRVNIVGYNRPWRETTSGDAGVTVARPLRPQGRRPGIRRSDAGRRRRAGPSGAARKPCAKWARGRVVAEAGAAIRC